MFARSNG